MTSHTLEKGNKYLGVDEHLDLRRVKLHKKEYNNLYSSPDVVQMIKSRTMLYQAYHRRESAKKVKLSLYQAVEALRVVRCRGSHII
jgi:hypothetical protein